MSDEAIAKVLQRHTRQLASLPGVVGVAEGEADGRKCITLYVSEMTSSVVRQIPSEVEGWPVVVRESGDFRALRHGSELGR
jgi:hypothetical protein